MRVIALRVLREFWLKGHSSSEGQFRAWYRAAEKAEWQSFSEVRQEFPSVDQVGDKLVFNIAGNRYRLIVGVDYPRKGLLIRWVGTHAEYDKLDVKEL